jgi:putative tryptophan/tyrosine transport system substrate-binding protein
MSVGRTNRRAFIAGLGSAAAWPVVGRGQQPEVPVIGILSYQARESEASRLEAIRQGLQETGFVEGQNVRIELRFADGQRDRLSALAGELIAHRVAVLLANTTPPALAAKTATKTVPVVFVTGVDPIELDLVASLNRPGGNLTGVTFLSNKLVAKRLALLCEIVPPTAAIGMLAARHNPNTPTDVRDAQTAAAALGRTLHVMKVANANDIDAAIAELVRHGVAALFIAPQANFRDWQQQMLMLAVRHALPTSFSSGDFVVAGGLMSYGPDQHDSYRQAGVYVGRILKGEKPAELPVMQSTKFEIVLNRKTADAIGVTIPPTLFAIATQVIE